MKIGDSFRFKLILLYILIMVIPMVLIVFVMPGYYRNVIAERTMKLTESTLYVLTQNVETYLEELERMTISPYYSDDVMWALKYKQQYAQTGQPDPALLILMNKSLNQTLHNFIRLTRKDILGTLLITSDGTMYVKSNSVTEPVDGYPYQDQGWYQQALAADGKAVFISSHSQDYLKQPSAERVFSVARMIKDPDTRKPLAFIMADASTRAFEEIANQENFSIQTNIVILDEYNNPIYLSNAVTPEMLAQLTNEPEYIEGSNERFLQISKTIPAANWKIFMLMSYTEIEKQFRWLYWAGGAFAIGGTVVTFTVFWLLTRWIIHPFKKMVHIMKTVQRGEFDTRMEVRGKDEVAQLGHALNNMIMNLKELIDREYLARLNQKQAEYRSLQSQINPHFLYNILNGFIGLNRMGEKELLEKSIISLSKMLRYVLDPSEHTTLSEEWLFLRRYCELQQLRYRDRLNVNIVLDPSIAAVRIPKLLIQPIVENAMIHGIEPMDRACMLSIQADHIREHGKHGIRILVTDDGAGFVTEEIIDPNKHIGLANVKERLRLAYPDATVTIQSKPGQGTNVTFHIPWQEVQ